MTVLSAGVLVVGGAVDQLERWLVRWKPGVPTPLFEEAGCTKLRGAVPVDRRGLTGETTRSRCHGHSPGHKRAIPVDHRAIDPAVGLRGPYTRR
jgi:hypothetical protein